MDINKTIEFYILKFIKIGNMGFFRDLDLEKLKIHNFKNDIYYFSYEEGYTEKNTRNYSFIMGTIEHSEIKICAQKIVKVNVEGEEISFITLKNGKYNIIDGRVIYNEHYSTTKKINGNEKYTESMDRSQNYYFKNGIKDFITNYKNLVSKKWPIIKNSEGKKLVKKCWL